MLSPTVASTYLIDQALLNPKDIVQGRFEIKNISHRNQNMTVSTSGGESYFLKQGDGQTGAGTVDHEANIYQCLQTLTHHSKFAIYLPDYVSYEPTLQLLIIKHLDNARDLRQYHIQRGKFPKSFASEIGRLLGLLHQLPCNENSIPQTISLESVQPWVFSIDQPELKIFQNISKAALDLVKHIQQFDDFGANLQALKQSWRSHTLIHNDIKLDNFLIYRQTPDRSHHSVKLIDWEFAGLGDPAWDVAGIFSSYLSFWVRSMPITGEIPPEEFMDLARYPLATLQVTMSTFWTAYHQQMEFDSTQQLAHLIKATQFAAVRILQTAFEVVMTTGQMTNNVVCLLQLSLNLMTYPQPGITSLLGISLPEAE